MPKKHAKPDPQEKARSQVPALLPHEVADLKLRQLGQRVQRGFLEVGEAIWQARQVRAHEHYGFADPVAYAEARTGLRYRTLARLLVIHEATLRVPDSEREELKNVFAEIGSHKSSVISAAVGHPDADWRTLAQFAVKATEDALQSRVSADLGRARTGSLDAPGEKFFRYLLANCPPEAQDLIKQTFELGFRLCGSSNSWAVLIALCEEQAPGWLERVEKGVE
mgnify:CR=1 FL=1